jgi:hypothetical protein
MATNASGHTTSLGFSKSSHKEFMNQKKKTKINIRYISTSESAQEQIKTSAFK